MYKIISLKILRYILKRWKKIVEVYVEKFLVIKGLKGVGIKYIYIFFFNPFVYLRNYSTYFS